MAVIKCKMCGGDLVVEQASTVAECEYCGSMQTLPKVNDEVIQNLFNRANNLRLKCEFDKAEQIYEKILQQNDNEPEAHWGIILCKYGIEYVEDPKTFKRIPTCHRTSYDAVTTDADYLAAIENADVVSRGIYEAEAKAIDEIQKNILNIVKNEKPFDVFICYKETDENGKRTVDSTIANDIYHQLTQEGLKVFYAAITLEDKLGQEYEPYIFAALNSAKAMLVIGTKPEYFNAVWVKNEWSRYLKLMKTDRSKLLIPCYKDMDAYDLPEEFAHLQAQDMSKIGFINDVVRGIKKVIVKDEPKTETVVKQTIVTEGNTNTAPLLKRAFMFLEDGDWKSADEYCEKVLDLDPECAEAYLGKLLAEMKICHREDLKNENSSFEDNPYYKKAMRFGDAALKNELQGYIEFIAEKRNRRIKEEVERKREKQYTEALTIMKSAKTEADFRNAAIKFNELTEYKNSKELHQECLDKAQEARKEAFYIAGVTAMKSAKTEEEFKAAAKKFEDIHDHCYKDSQSLHEKCIKKAEEARKDAIYITAKGEVDKNKSQAMLKAATLFTSIKGWKDAEMLARECEKKAEELAIVEEQARLAQERINAQKKKEEEKRKKRNKIIIVAVGSILTIALIVYLLCVNYFIPNSKYNDAIDLMNNGEYESAIAVFEGILDYKDSDSKITECKTAILENKYQDGISLFNNGEYEKAIKVFEGISSYRDSQKQIERCKDAILDRDYQAALQLLSNKEYQAAHDAFVALGDYSDSEEMAKESMYQYGLSYWNEKNYEDSNPIFESLGNYKDSKDKIHKHEYDSKITLEPACETEGTTQYNCKSCSHSYTEPIAATGHTYSQEITTKPTCEGEGTKTLTCDCGHITTASIAPTGHDYSSKITIAPTCDKPGVKTLTCKCGKSYTETISATGHDYSSKITNAPTCDKPGVKTLTCKCGKSHTETISAKGHSFVEATCEKAKYCKTCNKTEGSALGHDWEHQHYGFYDIPTCTRCDTDINDTISVSTNCPITLNYDSTKFNVTGISYQVKTKGNNPQRLFITLEGVVTDFEDYGPDHGFYGVWVSFKLYSGEGVLLKTVKAESGLSGNGHYIAFDYNTGKFGTTSTFIMGPWDIPENVSTFRLVISEFGV